MKSSLKQDMKQALHRLHLEALATKVASHKALTQNRDERDTIQERDERDNRHLLVALAATLRPRSDCVDVGANHGFVAARMQEIAFAGRVVAFEPLPHLAEELRRRLPKVDVREVALGARNGSARFSYAVDDDAYSRFSDVGFPRAMPTRELDVAVRTLDSSLPPGFQPCFIKIDVERSEMEVLEGSVRTLEEHHPVIWLEHGLCAHGYKGCSSQDLWDFLCQRFGYTIFNADGEGPVPRERFWPYPGRPKMWTWLAV